MDKTIYKNKETGKKVITSEKLDKKHWEKVSVIKSGQMNPGKVFTKKK